MTTVEVNTAYEQMYTVTTTMSAILENDSWLFSLLLGLSNTDNLDWEPPNQSVGSLLLGVRLQNRWINKLIIERQLHSIQILI